MTDQPLDRANADPSVAAGDDFFRHTNGGWLDANPVPPEYPVWGGFVELHVRNEALLHELAAAAAAAGSGLDAATMDPVERRFGDYFAAGMDEAAIEAAGVEPIAHLLDLAEGLADHAGLAAVVLAYQRDGVRVLHGIGVLPDFDDADRYLVYLGQGGLSLPEPGYHTRDDERSAAIRAALAAHIAAQLVNLGASEADATADAAAILAFEARLAAVSWPPEKLRDVNLTLNRVATDALDVLMPRFGLTGYVRALGGTQPTLSVDNQGFFGELDGILAETPIATIRAYLRWHAVRTYASSLPARFADEAFAFYGRLLGGQQAQQPRWKRVLAGAGADIGETVAQRFVAATFPPEAKDRCEQMIGHLVSAMRRSIEGLTWMTDATRTEALAKLAGFKAKIGYPDQWRDEAPIGIDRSSWAANRIRAARFELGRQLARIDEPVDRGEWAIAAHVVNAYYHPLLNEIVFPAGILQPPFFWADADDAVNYGGIGTVIGHEITHGFDDQGSRFDAAGRKRDWWTEDDRIEFERLATRLAEQFDEYEVADGARVNGRLTLGENIADLGGVAIALAALREAVGPDAPLVDGLTSDQRFFLAYATIWRLNATEAYLRMQVNVDPHAPARFRVNGPLSNVPAFAEAFGVPEGSPMARMPEDRVRIW
jgi:predicted metalloendopeptidase